MDEVEVQQRARQFMAPLDLRHIRDELGVYVKAANAVLLEEEMEEGESGTTFTRPDGKHVITINSSDSLERQRFTICHEVGHIVLGLPSSHENVPAWSYAKRDANERACDGLAAELLMPYEQWLLSMPKDEPSLAVVERMASEFRCSFPAAASRYAMLAPFPCAFVTMEGGAVRYAVRSTALRRAKAWISPRASIPIGSVAHRLRSEDVSGTDTGTVDQDIWFDHWGSGLDMTEMSRHYRSSDTTISILWFDEAELPEREFDRFGQAVEEQGARRELTGELPWPSKARRR
jgi:Zn-dependent peptidase ImmA (M78 family)